MSDDPKMPTWLKVGFPLYVIGSIAISAAGLFVLYGIVRLFFKYAFDVVLWNPFG